MNKEKLTPAILYYGLIYTGYNHSEIRKKIKSPSQGQEGFVYNGKFLDRFEALKIFNELYPNKKIKDKWGLHSYNLPGHEE